ncbi:MAG: hypothetical protein U1F26_15460 [Lysobacterales bacterium]
MNKPLQSSKWSVLAFALALGAGVGAQAAINCDQQFKQCLADGHTPKTMCLAELRECRAGNP